MSAISDAQSDRIIQLLHTQIRPVKEHLMVQLIYVYISFIIFICVHIKIITFICTRLRLVLWYLIKNREVFSPENTRT